uniref:Uncharacterized protein n=1 Tax=Zea mays TaxID=4577 RepID=A0A804MEW7_MAIZE
MQLKDIVIRIETDIMDEVAKAFEIATLRGEIRILSTHWMNKTKNLKSQLKKHKRTDQELKKRVLKLEFCLRSCHPLHLLTGTGAETLYIATQRHAMFNQNACDHK